MPTGYIQAAAETALEALAAEYDYVKLHTGDPGAAATLNAATETDRVQVTWGSAAISGDGQSVEIEWTVDAEWTSVAGSEDYTHISGWNDPAAGTPGWTGELTADAVVVGNDFRIPAGAYTLRQPIAYNP